jgi:hypothetical protein
MKTSIIVAGLGALSFAAWMLMQAPADEVRAAPPSLQPKMPVPGQAGWFAAAPQSGGSWPDPRAATMAAASVNGRNGRAINLGGLTVAQYIATRVGKARSGDAGAAYEVYQAESVCAANDDPVADYAEPAQKEQFLREREALGKLCTGMSPAQVQERLGFLATAARAGNRNAQVDFYMEGPYGRAFDMAGNADDPTVKQWKEDALGYLKQAAGTCDHFSLALLANVYDAGLLTERDMRSSMAYAIAAAVPRNKPLTEQQLTARFGEELGPADFASARQMGEQIVQQACSK